MRILILGSDGYLGGPTVAYLQARGHEVTGVDNGMKRTLERRVGVRPLLPKGNILPDYVLDISRDDLRDCFLVSRFDAIIHYAEQPSAPYSMLGPDEAVETQRNNVLGTLNVLWAIKDTDIHLVKLGTMGEYGTPNIDIEEGWLEVEHKGRRDRMLYPKKPGSWYHASKVHDSANIEMACRLWGIRATDLNQGVVYGIETPETQTRPDLRASFHYDHIFGTALNRFVTQAALGIPPTIYGEGGQTRGWLNILDTLQCVELACLNPAAPGEFRVFNQMTETFSIAELANRVGRLRDLRPRHIENPRIEAEEHYYHVVHTGLRDIGLEPHLLTDEVIEGMIREVEQHKDNVDINTLMPTVKWK